MSSPFCRTDPRGALREVHEGRGDVGSAWPDDATAPAEPENRLAATFYGRLSGGLKNIWDFPM